MFLIQRTTFNISCAQRQLISCRLSGVRCLSDKNNNESDEKAPVPDYNDSVKREHPVSRTGRVLKDDMIRIKNWTMEKYNIMTRKTERKTYAAPIHTIDNFIQNRERETMFQTHCDVLVIGGGGIGSSIAYWLKKRAAEGLNVVVVEKDPTYKEASTPLSLGGLRQQFSLEENIQMSLYGSDFIRNIKEHLGDDVDVQFSPYGYLMLATEESAETLIRNSRLQNELGAKNEILSARQLKEKFPWISTDGIEIGCHGLEKEGWFDPWLMLYSMKKRAIEFGAHYLNGEVVGFQTEKNVELVIEGSQNKQYDALSSAIVKMPDGSVEPIKFALCVIAAGAHSAKVGEMAGIGTGSDLLSIPIPIEPRKRYVYVMACDEKKPHLASSLNTPVVIDPSGVYFRREGLTGLYVAGRSPESIEKEPPIDNLDVDYGYFDTDVWPHLAHRVPKFEAVKVKSAWAGYYEYNTFDENGIIGPHPSFHNLYIASGFSGHGIQQAPAVGRCIAEMIVDGGYITLDLSRLSFDRIVVDKPIASKFSTQKERNLQNSDDLSSCDVVVIGGGAVGSSTAFWLKKRAKQDLKVIVVEKDPTYKEASTPRSLGGIRQQFSLVENIQLSLFGFDFIDDIKNYMNDDVDVQFTPFGYLMLAADEYAEALHKNSKLQKELGAKNEILMPSRLKEKFPWLNTTNVAVGCFGYEKEGWFDPWHLLIAFKKNAIRNGANYVNGEVVGFELNEKESENHGSIKGVKVKLSDGSIKEIKCEKCVLAAGAESGRIGRLAGIGTGSNLLSIPIPIEPRKRYVYVFMCENPGKALNSAPYVFFPSGAHVRNEGGNGYFTAGRSPRSKEFEPPIGDLEPDFEYFNNEVWPTLADYVPQFEAIKVTSAWAGHYEVNTLDENGIIGRHPWYQNLYIASGFSGHGIQQSPASGRAVAELILDGRFTTIDLTRLGFERIVKNEP
ncbi:CLUMA_CG007805, isoform A, partial [Clunio marinus]